MALRSLTAALLVAAAAADAASASGLAFYFLLAVVPGAGAAALAAYGEVVEGRRTGGQALLWGVVLALVVLGAAVRSSAPADGPAPAAAVAFGACLAALSLEALLAVAAEARSRPAPSSWRGYVGSAPAASRARSISGRTATNVATVTARHVATDAWSRRSAGGEPPAGAKPSSAEGRMYIARMTAR